MKRISLVLALILLSDAIALLMFAATSLQANDIPYCEASRWGGVKAPSHVQRHKGCTGVTGGNGFRNGYMVDCKGRKLCKLPERLRIGVAIGEPSTEPPKTASPEQIGRLCIIHQKDGEKTYLINKCLVDLNIKWNDRFCKSSRREKYPCAVSIQSNGRERRRLIVHDTTKRRVVNESKDENKKETITYETQPITYEAMPDFGTITIVACKSPSYPYEDSYGRVHCQ